MEPQVARTNITRFYIYKALASFGLWTPVWVLYLQQRRGLSLGEITVMDAGFWAVLALAEIPTGAVADTFGRKTSMVVGIALQAFSFGIYGLATTFPALLAANLLWGVAISFVSGADQAFIYDTLRAAGRAEDYPRIAGRAMALIQGCAALGGAVGGFIGSYDLALPILLTAAIDLLALGVALTLREPPVEAAHAASLRYYRTVQQTWGFLRAEPALRYTMLYGALLPIAWMILTFVFIQPHAHALGVPVAAMGLLLVAIRAGGMVGSFTAHRIVGRTGERLMLVTAPTLIVISLLLLALIRSPVGLAFFVIITFVTAVSRPSLESMVLRQLPSSVRATMISAQSLLATLILTGVEPGLGFVADRWGLPMAYGVLGLVMSLALAPLLLVWDGRAAKGVSASTHQGQVVVQEPSQ